MVDSLKIREKFCVNCKFFRKDNINNVYGQCSLFPIDNNYLVTGNKNSSKYYFCSTARKLDILCGKNATKYEKLKQTSSLLD